MTLRADHSRTAKGAPIKLRGLAPELLRSLRELAVLAGEHVEDLRQLGQNDERCASAAETAAAQVQAAQELIDKASAA